jgi:hypothetical protein
MRNVLVGFSIMAMVVGSVLGLYVLIGAAGLQAGKVLAGMVIGVCILVMSWILGHMVELWREL